MSALALDAWLEGDLSRIGESLRTAPPLEPPPLADSPYLGPSAGSPPAALDHLLCPPEGPEPPAPIEPPEEPAPPVEPPVELPAPGPAPAPPGPEGLPRAELGRPVAYVTFRNLGEGRMAAPTVVWQPGGQAELEGMDMSWLFGRFESLILELLTGQAIPKPASAAAVAALEDRTPGPEDGSCPICLGELAQEEDQQAVCAMPCGHLFHKECLKNWLSRRNNCPTCRHELEPEPSMMVELISNIGPPTPPP